MANVEKSQTKIDKATPKQINLIENKLAKKRVSLDQLNRYLHHTYKVDNLSDLTRFQASNIIVDLNNNTQIEEIKNK